MSDFLSNFSDGSGGELSYTEQLRPAWMKDCVFRLVKDVPELRRIVDGILAVEGRPPCSLDVEGEGLDLRVYTADQLDVLDAVRALPRVRSYGPKGDKKKRTYKLPPLTEADKEWIRRVGHAPVCRICGVSFSPDGVTGFYVPLRHRPDSGRLEDWGNLPLEGAVEQLRRLVLGTSLRMARAIFDFEELEMDLGLPMTEVVFEDVQIKHYLIAIHEKTHGLKHLSESLLDRPMIEFEDVTADGRNAYELHPEEIYEYAGADATETYLLNDYLDIFCWIKRGTPVRGKDDYRNPWRADKKDWSPEGLPADYRTRQTEGDLINLLALQKSVSAVEHGIVTPLRELERRTVLIDVAFYKRMMERTQGLKDIAEREARDLLGDASLNIGSPEVIGEVLFGKIGVPHPLADTADGKKDTSKTATGKWKTDEDTLDLAYEKWGDTFPVLKTIVRYRKLDKAIGSYYQKLATNVDPLNRARLKFQAWSVDTGRFAAPGGSYDQEGSTGVNWHALPAPYDPEVPEEMRVVREGLIAPPGFVVLACDFSGEELRIATNYSREPKWLKEFQEGTGDLHSVTARVIYNLPDDGQKAPDDKRQNGKKANFCKLYGGGGPGIARSLKCSIEEGWRVSRQMDAGLKGIFSWHRRMEALAEQQGYVQTAGGRVRLVPEIYADKKKDSRLYSFGCRTAVNTVVQGAGADLLKIALVLLRKELIARGWYENDVYPVHHVHDEIIFYVRISHFLEAVDVIAEVMRLKRIIAAWGWPVGLEMERKVGSNWGHLTDWDKVLKGKAKAPELLAYLPLAPREAPVAGAPSGPSVEAPSKPGPPPRSVPPSVTIRVISPLNRKTMVAIARACRESPGETRLVLTNPMGDMLLPENVEIRIEVGALVANLGQTAVTILKE